MIAFLIMSQTVDAATMGSAQRAVVTNAENPDAWVDLGDAYRRRFQKKRARAAYGQALLLDATHEDAQAKLARLSSRRNPRLVRIALRDPTNDEAWGDAGDYYVANNMPEEAMGAYRHALRLDPGDSEWHQAVINLGDIDALVGIMDQLMEGTDDETMGNVADSLRQYGNTEEACTLYQRASELDPGDTEWERALARCNGEALPDGDQLEAMMSGSSMLPSSSPMDRMRTQVYANDELLTRLGIAHAKAGDLENARRYLHSSLLISPVNTATLESFAAVTGQTRLEILERLVEEVPDNDEVLGELGDQLLAEGRAQEAAAHYRLALEIDADDPEWTEKLSLLEAIEEHR